MDKILCFFGAFNPPTKAHIELAKLAMKETKAAYTVFVPSKSSYILEDQKKGFCFSDDERVRMLADIMKNNTDLFISFHDLEAETQPRTYETLKHLEEKWMEESYFYPTLLIGADQFFDMEKNWKNVPEIAKEFGIVVLTRRAFSIQSLIETSEFYKAIAPYVTVVETPQNMRNISSSWIRNELAEAQDHIRHIKEDIMPETYEYIKENYLYEI